MTKIKLDSNGDYTPLSVEQVRALFGFASPEHKAILAGLEICLAVVPGADRGMFQRVAREYNDDFIKVVWEDEKNITLGDDEIEQYIEIIKPSQESKHGGYVSLRQEYADRGVSPKDFI